MAKPQAVLTMGRPSKASPDLKPVAFATPNEGTKRLVVDLPLSKHTALKSKASERGVSMKAYVLELLQNGAGI